MKKLIAFCICTLCIYGSVFSQTMEKNYYLYLLDKAYQGTRANLVEKLKEGDSQTKILLQTEETKMFVTRQIKKNNYFFVFYLQNSEGYWAKYTEIEYGDPDTIIDSVSFKDGVIVLGMKKEAPNVKTLYYYCVHKNSRWKFETIGLRSAKRRIFLLMHTCAQSLKKTIIRVSEVEK